MNTIRHAVALVRGTGLASLVLTALMLATAVACDGGAERSATIMSDLSSPQPPTGTYVLDPEHSFVYFAAQHRVVGTVRGRFNRVRATVMIAADPQLSRVDVVIEASSVDTQSALRDVALRGPDFFDAQMFPTIEYHGGHFRRTREGWIVDGALTVRGFTRHVPLLVSFKGIAPKEEGGHRRVAIHATGAVMRADYGMTRQLLDEIGVTSANPDVWIDVDAEFLVGGRSIAYGRTPSSSNEEGR